MQVKFPETIWLDWKTELGLMFRKRRTVGYDNEFEYYDAHWDEWQPATLEAKDIAKMPEYRLVKKRSKKA